MDGAPPRLMSTERFRRILFYGVSAGIIVGLLIHIIWRESRLFELERRLRIAGVPSEWFGGKSRAGLIDSNLFNIFKTGPSYDLLFWPMAGATIACYWCLPSPRRPGLRLIAWTIAAAVFGLFSIARTHSQFEGIIDRQIPLALKSVSDWEEWKAKQSDHKHGSNLDAANHEG